VTAERSAPWVLALDQGGHASRAIVFDSRGAERSRAEVAIATFHPAADHVEHDATAIVESLHRAAQSALNELGASRANVARVALATQRSTIVCWDRTTGAALSPALSWQDRRAAGWLAAQAPDRDRLHRITGLPPSPHYGASKIRWCLDHLPAVQAARDAGRLACGPLASFLLFHLLDERPFVVDPANAARTLLWNLATRDWDDALLHHFHIARALLPQCVPSRHHFGALRLDELALPMVCCTGDQSAALTANGAPARDVATLNLGTGAFVQCPTGSAPVFVAGLLSGIVNAGPDGAEYVLEGTVNGAGSALDWAASELAVPDLISHLDDWFQQETAPPLFLNGIGGLGAPFWVANFESRFIGEGSIPSRAVAVAESILFLVQANLERLPPVTRLVATGGLSRSAPLMQRLADLSGLPVDCPAEHEATARGLAWLALDRPHDWPPSPLTRYTPQANEALRGRYRRFREELDKAILNVE
jgi:glycerol kinase